MVLTLTTKLKTPSATAACSRTARRNLARAPPWTTRNSVKVTLSRFLGTGDVGRGGVRRPLEKLVTVGAELSLCIIDSRARGVLTPRVPEVLEQASLLRGHHFKSAWHLGPLTVNFLTAVDLGPLYFYVTPYKPGTSPIKWTMDRSGG